MLELLKEIDCISFESANLFTVEDQNFDELLEFDDTGCYTSNIKLQSLDTLHKLYSIDKPINT